MKTLLGIAALVFVCATSAPGQTTPRADKHAPPKRQDNIACATCHSCSAPTKTNPCLSPCPRARIIPEYHPAKSGPEVVIMSRSSEQYGPVVFSHRLHADMSEMSGGCYGCHHYNSTSMAILSCKECHPASRARTDISMPDLKGAYHRQCMDCHRQWGKTTECTTCHITRGPGQTTEEALATARLKGKGHPDVPSPDRVVYETRSQKGTVVTFFHNDHAVRFGLECRDCHKAEACVRCHEKGAGRDTASSAVRVVRPQRSMETLHAPCSSCHEINECTACHTDKPMAAFDHGRRTGWPLNRFHENLSCQKCHGQTTRFTKLDTGCVRCHTNWAPGSFKHDITGFRLDASHAEFDCISCHPDNAFGTEPSCSGCHDDKTYPKDRPGRSLPAKAR